MLISITRDSGIPLFGLDFVGVLDRGTNLIEVRPTTLCNLRCGYCYANAGNNENEFEVEEDYLVEKFAEIVEFKKIGDIEAHIDPYGEGLLYKELGRLIQDLKSTPGVVRVSMQSNGTLLTEEKISELRQAGLDQINITLNAMDEGMAKKLACREDYELDHLLAMLDAVLESGMDLVIAPVWFFSLNDAEIERVIQHYVSLKARYPEGTRVRLGIQNYLVYKTGRKLGGKVREREFSYFYQRLKQLEKSYGTKLVLGPRDFGIHPAPMFRAEIPELKHVISTVPVEILSPGRQEKEFIGRLGGWAVKVVNFRAEPIDPAAKPVLRIPVGSIDVKANLISAVLRR